MTLYWVKKLTVKQRSAEIDKVTFEELVYLHQQLLRNDGIDSPGPLHFTLGTRPEFAKRFVGLLAGASEGKGLSELIPRDEQSENYDDVDISNPLEEMLDTSQGYTHDDDEYDIPLQNDENADPSVHSVNDAEGESIHDITSMPEGLDHVAHDQSIDARNADEEKDARELSVGASRRTTPVEQRGEGSMATSGKSNSNPTTPSPRTEFLDATNQRSPLPGFRSSGPPSPRNLTNVTSPAHAGDAVHESQEVQSEQKTEASPKSASEPHDEVDDLIDYSDEEDDNTKRVAPQPKSRSGNYFDFVTPCLKPGVCFCSACNEILLADFEAIDENLRRRSLSLAAETQSATDIVDGTHSAANGATTTEAQEPTNGTNNADNIDFDIDEEVKQVDDAPQEYWDDEEDDGETHAIQDISGKVDDYYTGFDDQQEGEYAEPYDFDGAFEDGQYIESEDQNLKAKSGGLQVVTSTVTELTSMTTNDTPPHEEISAESVTVSADTVDVDEIDYEDDLPTTTVENAFEASNPIQSHGSREADDIDEIDYEDDDEEGVVTPQSSKLDTLQHTSSNTPGKRQRSESMSEVPLGEGNQGKS